MDHHLRLSHDRYPLDRSGIGDPRPASSEVEINASGEDLTDCWAEVLSRLPNDVYAALKLAMGVE